MAKVQWMKETKEQTVFDEKTGQEVKDVITIQPEESKVPLTLLKEKQPLKLLEYYECLYFEGK